MSVFGDPLEEREKKKEGNPPNNNKTKTKLNKHTHPQFKLSSVLLLTITQS